MERILLSVFRFRELPAYGNRTELLFLLVHLQLSSTIHSLNNYINTTIGVSDGTVDWFSKSMFINSKTHATLNTRTIMFEIYGSFAKPEDKIKLSDSRMLSEVFNKL